MSKPLLPVVSPEIVAAYKHSFNENPGSKTEEELEILKSENPFLYEVVDYLTDRSGLDKADSFTLVLTVYSLLRRQAEVDELNSSL